MDADSSPAESPGPKTLQAHALFQSPLVSAYATRPMTQSFTPGVLTPAFSTPAFTPGKATPLLVAGCEGLTEPFLREGWKKYESQSTGRSFYRNRVTGQTQWTCPHCDPDYELKQARAAAAQLQGQPKPAGFRGSRINPSTSFARLGTSAFAVAEAADAEAEAVEAEQKAEDESENRTEPNRTYGGVLAVLEAAKEAQEEKIWRLMADAEAADAAEAAAEAAVNSAKALSASKEANVEAEVTEVADMGNPGTGLAKPNSSMVIADRAIGHKHASMGQRVLAQDHKQSSKALRSSVGAHEYKDLPKDVLLAKLDSLQTLRQQAAEDKNNNLEQRESKKESRVSAAETIWGSALVVEDVYIGLLIESEKPHLVVAVDNVVDKNYVKQGMPGYSNEEVVAGDRLIAVDGYQCDSERVEKIHSLLKGVVHTPVVLTLARNDDTMYKVEVMRHRKKDDDLRSSLFTNSVNETRAASANSSPAESVRKIAAPSAMMKLVATEFFKHSKPDSVPTSANFGASPPKRSTPDNITGAAEHAKSAGTELKRSNRVSAEHKEPGYVGLHISPNAPFSVLAVRGVMDSNYVKQGMPGYSNEEVAQGDRIMAVDGRECVSATLDVIHKLLKGFAHTEVVLTLARKGSGALYAVTLMRYEAEMSSAEREMPAGVQGTSTKRSTTKAASASSNSLQVSSSSNKILFQLL